MKFASLKSSNSRDGELCIVNKSLTQVTNISSQIPTLQYALENWGSVYSTLSEMYRKLNEGEVKNVFDYVPTQLAAPLPRTYQWIDGASYVTHLVLARQVMGMKMPESLWNDPILYQSGSNFVGPCDPIRVNDESYGIDFESEIAIITDDVPMGVSVQEATKHIILILLVNDTSLRNLIIPELLKGFGPFQSKPASSASPVAVTPDELYPSWDWQRLKLPLLTYLNNKLFGKPNTGDDMVFSFPQLIAHAAKTRSLSAGTIIGSGVVSNAKHDLGSSCIVEKRLIETLENGSPKTPYLKYGDKVRIEMKDVQGKSIFGAIDQLVSKS